MAALGASSSTPESAVMARPAVSTEMLSMAEERARSPLFDIRRLTHFLDGGEEATKFRIKTMFDLERDPSWRMDDYPNLTLPQLRERTIAKAPITLHFMQNEPHETFRKRMATIALVDPGFWTRFGVHYGLFFGALESQATPEQFQYWVQQGALLMNGVIGCFGMTELGHGSNVAGLETTATFDEASDEFVVHSPTLTSSKWWIGGAAQTCTHCAVYARLNIKDKFYGVRTFIVPLRDPETFSLLPGVNIGDCGKKLGRDGIDNGYIQFTNVRIPRNYMLMRHTRVDRTGAVTMSPLPPQISYGALIQGRAAMVVDSGNTAKKALTIAIRYAAVRRQGFVSAEAARDTESAAPQVQAASKPAPPEKKLLDYSLHQYRLLPLLAQAFAMHFAGVQMDALYVRLMQEIRGDSPPADSKGAAKNAAFSEKMSIGEILKEAHANSAGLKAFCTWNTLNIIEQCRQTLGGHGFSEYAALAPMMRDWTVQCSWEGDNTVLALQLGRYLISCLKKVRSGRSLRSPGVAYLNSAAAYTGKSCDNREAAGLADFALYSEAINVVSARAVMRASEVFDASVQSSKCVSTAFEACARPRFDAARIHSINLLYHSFLAAYGEAPADLRKVLGLLLHVYAMSTIVDNASVFLEFEYFTPKHINELRKLLHTNVQLLRTQAVHITDAFMLTDYVIGTPFGRYDGNIYEHYMARVRSLNPPQIPHPYFERLIKPVLARKNESLSLKSKF